ncbi:MAG: GNAT family N-acetyltransferase [Gemmatimonadota bacterium]
MSVEVRAAVPKDRDRIALFNQALARETEGRELDRKTLLRGVEAVLGDPARGRYLVAEKDGEVVGQLAITYEWSDWRNGRVWWIQSVYVSRHHRREGVYSALHRYVRELARAEKAVGLRLYTERDNEPAHRAYRALGMSESSYVMYEEMWG